MFANNTHRTLEKRNRRHRHNGIFAARPLLEPLEGRQLLSAVIAGVFGGVPAAAAGGTDQAINFSLTNTGDAIFRGSVAVDFYAAPVGTPFNAAADVLLGNTVRSGPIAIGGIKTFSVPLSISPALVTGSYQIFAVVSPDSASNQSSLVEGGPISITQANMDLAVSTGTARLPSTISFAALTPGSVRVTLTNPKSSSVAIPAGQSVDVELVARPVGATSSFGDVLLNRKALQVNVGGLAPGASRTVTVPLSLSAVPVGNYSIVAEIDTQRTLAESTFANNQAVLAGVFTVTPPAVSIANPGTVAVGVTPTGASIPSTKIGVTPVSSVGVTPVNVGGTTITGTLGITPINSIGITPTNNLGLTTTSAIGLTPTNPLGLTPTSASGYGQMTITGNLSLTPII